MRWFAAMSLIGALMLCTGGCGSGAPGDNQNDNGSGPTDNTNDNGAAGGTDDVQRVGMDAAIRSAMSLIALRIEDDDRFAQQQSTPCPLGGSRMANADGSMTLMNCVLFPGFSLSGDVTFVAQEGDLQGFVIDADNLSGVSSATDTQFLLNGSIQEIENEDGSLTFRMDFFSAQTTEGTTDVFALTGEIVVQQDGSMIGSMSGDSGSMCLFDGANIFSIIAGGEQGLERTCFYPPLDGCVADNRCEIECRPPFADADPDCSEQQLCDAYGLCDNSNGNGTGNGNANANANDNDNGNGNGNANANANDNDNDNDNGNDNGNGNANDNGGSVEPVEDPILTSSATLQYGDYDLPAMPGTRLYQVALVDNPSPDLQPAVPYEVLAFDHNDSCPGGISGVSVRFTIESGSIVVDSFVGDSGACDSPATPAGELPLTLTAGDNVLRPTISWAPQRQVYTVIVRAADGAARLYGIRRQPGDDDTCSGCVLLSGP